MEANNIGYTFWPYKKVDNSCMNAVARPSEWDSIVAFSEAPRGSYAEVRAARPSQQLSRRLMAEYLHNCRFDSCTPQPTYIRSMKLNY